jgi:hypothetical protein
MRAASYKRLLLPNVQKAQKCKRRAATNHAYDPQPLFSGQVYYKDRRLSTGEIVPIGNFFACWRGPAPPCILPQTGIK